MLQYLEFYDSASLTVRSYTDLTKLAEAIRKHSTGLGMDVPTFSGLAHDIHNNVQIGHPGQIREFLSKLDESSANDYRASFERLIGSINQYFALTDKPTERLRWVQHHKLSKDLHHVIHAPANLESQDANSFYKDVADAFPTDPLIDDFRVLLAASLNLDSDALKIFSQLSHIERDEHFAKFYWYFFLLSKREIENKSYLSRYIEAQRILLDIVDSNTGSQVLGH
ncbi:MAG: hypothetical protein HRU19_32245 [Pseudobacteriovorax sp.]|nr:hypothetical protein [Pseudobacteriovorax sp.]